MTHDTTEAADDTMGSSQAQFLGWLAVGLIGLIALFVLVVFAAAAANGFR